MKRYENKFLQLNGRLVEDEIIFLQKNNPSEIFSEGLILSF